MNGTATLEGLVDLIPVLSVPDPRPPARQLAGLDPTGLRLAAEHTLAAARRLAAAGETGQQSLAELARGWSSPAPGAGVTRLLVTAAQTAAILHGQATAMETTATVIERARSNGQLDISLAVAELAALRRHGWSDALDAVVGVPQLADAVRAAAVVRRLHEALTGRLQTVEVAVASMLPALSGDPTAGPDGLRGGGPEALLPPDPVMNPADRTDRRNRATLAADLGSGNPGRIRFAMAILQSLQHAGDRGGTAQLVVYDPTAFAGQGRAAISVGDLTTATDVAVLVPGITNSPSAMNGGIDQAADLRDEAHRQAPDQDTAVVAWYGYDIPMSWAKDPESGLGTDIRDTVAAGSAANASTGAPVLAADLADIRTMSQTSTRLSVLGFSMGSTTVSEAARYRIPVDSVVLLGSPGAGWDTDSAAGYASVKADDVYVLSYDQDPVTLPVTDDLASSILRIHDPYGPDPASASFGGHHIDAGTNVPLVSGTGLASALLRILGDPRHHSMSNYMRGRALTAEGAIVLGRTDEVPTKPGR